MAHWTLEDMLQEVKHLEKLEERKSAVNILHKMYVSLVEKLKCCQLNATVVLKLLEAFEDSKLPEERKDFLLKALDGNAVCTSAFKVQAGQQGVAHLPKYLTDNDWAKLRQHTLLMDAMGVIIGRMKQMGLVSLKESCKKQAMALLLHWFNEHGKPLPGPWQIYFMAKDFQAMYACTNVQCSVGCSENYPWKPEEMGQDWLNKVYGESGKPAGIELPLAMFSDKIPLRSTSKLLKGIPRPEASNAPPAGVATPQNATQLHKAACPAPVDWHRAKQEYMAKYNVQPCESSPSGQSADPSSSVSAMQPKTSPRQESTAVSQLHCFF